MFFMDPKLVLFVIGLPVISGCLLFDIIEERTRVDPVQGDLSLVISMNSTVFEARPQSMILTIVLKNECEHRVWVDEAFFIGYTLYPEVFAANGSEVNLDYDQVDREPVYSWFDPDETKTKTVDLSRMTHSIEIDGEDIDFDWNMPGSYNISVGWWGSRTVLEVRSNTLFFEIVN